MGFRDKVSRRLTRYHIAPRLKRQNVSSLNSKINDHAYRHHICGTMGNLTSPVRENNSCRRLRTRFVTGPERTKAPSSFLTVRRRLWITRSDTGVRISGSLWQPVIGYPLSAIENFRTYWYLTRRRGASNFFTVDVTAKIRWRSLVRDLRGWISWTPLCDLEWF